MRRNTKELLTDIIAFFIAVGVIMAIYLTPIVIILLLIKWILF